MLPYNYDGYLHQLREDQGGLFPPSLFFVRTVNFEDMAKVYRKTADSGGFLLSTSLSESAPMTFIESMVCRCPVISSNVGGVQELIEHERTGFLYATGEIEAVVKILEETCASGESGLRQRIVENALSKPSSITCLRGRPALVSSRIRSKIIIKESTAMPRVKIIPAIPGRVSVAPTRPSTEKIIATFTRVMKFPIRPAIPTIVFVILIRLWGDIIGFRFAIHSPIVSIFNFQGVNNFPCLFKFFLI